MLKSFVQDGSEYQATMHAHATSTSAHINPPPDPVPLDTSDPYSKSSDDETAQHSASHEPRKVER